MEVTLEQLLQGREGRHLHQVSLLQLYPDHTLICLTVVLPGPVKRDGRSLRVAAAGVAAVRAAFSPVHEELCDLETGYEGYFVVPGGTEAVKAACCRIEDTHPLGRLMDLDVLELSDGRAVPVGRERVGLGPRRCLLCDRPARLCMREGRHSREELLARIDGMLQNAENL